MITRDQLKKRKSIQFTIMRIKASKIMAPMMIKRFTSNARSFRAIISNKAIISAAKNTPTGMMANKMSCRVFLFISNNTYMNRSLSIVFLIF